MKKWFSSLSLSLLVICFICSNTIFAQGLEAHSKLNANPTPYSLEGSYEYYVSLDSNRVATVEGIIINSANLTVDLEFIDPSSGYTLIKTLQAQLNARGYFKVVTEPLEISVRPIVEIQSPTGARYGTVDTEPGTLLKKYKSSLEYDQTKSSMDSTKIRAEIQDLKNRLALGDRITYSVDSSGQLWAWGSIPQALCDSSKDCNSTAPRKITKFKNVKQIAANYSTAAVLTTKGEVFLWRNNISSPILMKELQGAVQVQVGGQGHGMALKKDGTVTEWILPFNEPYHDVYESEITKAQIKTNQVKGLKNVTKILIGLSFYGDSYLALKNDGSVWAWKDVSVALSYKQKGKSADTGILQHVLASTDTPQELKGFPKVMDIGSQDAGPLLLTETYDLWGYTDTKDKRVNLPEKVASGVISTFQNMRYVMKEDGRYYPYEAAGKQISNEPFPPFNDYKIIASGTTWITNSLHYAGVKKDGTLMSWGGNNGGQLGIGKTAALSFAVNHIKNIKDPIALSANSGHVLALNKQGEIYGWGSNKEHEVKSGNTEDVLAPYKITTIKSAVQVAAGNEFSLALTKEGKLYGWGKLTRLGAAADSDKPLPLDLIQDPIKEIAAYNKSVVIWTSSGKVYHLGEWGSSNVTKNKKLVWQVNISDVISIGVSNDRGFVAKKDGSVWYWSGPKKEGLITASKISGFSGITKVFAGGDSFNGDTLIGIDKNKGLWRWNSSQSLVSNINQKPYRATKTYVGPVKEKLDYSTVSTTGRLNLYITTQKELLYEGKAMGGLLDQDGRNKNVTAIAAYGENYYWVSKGRLLTYGSSNNAGELGIGTKGWYEEPQKVLAATKLF